MSRWMMSCERRKLNASAAERRLSVKSRNEVEVQRTQLTEKTSDDPFVQASVFRMWPPVLRRLPFPLDFGLAPDIGFGVPRLARRDGSAVFDVHGQVTLGAVLHDEVDEVFGRDAIYQPDDVAMSDTFENIDLVPQVLQELVGEFGPDDRFDSDLVGRRRTSPATVDGRERASTDFFPDDEPTLDLVRDLHLARTRLARGRHVRSSPRQV